jgi:hypothetical protein
MWQGDPSGHVSNYELHCSIAAMMAPAVGPLSLGPGLPSYGRLSLLRAGRTKILADCQSSISRRWAMLMRLRRWFPCDSCHGRE